MTTQSLPDRMMVAESASNPVLGAAPGGEIVVELTRPIGKNSLHETYQALWAIGVQVCHTAIVIARGTTVQTLYLAELDDGRLEGRRIRQVLSVLNGA